MKKVLLLTIAIGFTAFCFAQNYMVKPEFALTKKAQISSSLVGMEPANGITITGAKAEQPSGTKGSRDLTIFSIGAAANAYGYGYAGGQRTILWADPDLDIFINLHRMTAATYSGNLAIDISYDRGETFTNNVMIYESNVSGGQYNIDAARYPQGGIYNPVGNTEPANARYAYYAPTTSGYNGGTWGTYAYGSVNMQDLTDTIKHLQDQHDDYFYNVPDAFTVVNTGKSWLVDVHQDWTTGSLVYKGSLIVEEGTYDEGLQDFVYDEYLIDCPSIAENGPSNVKVAFAPDGMTGYIVTLNDDGSVPFSEGAYYPMVYKTIDGGENWDEPVGVAIGGPDGIASIVYDWLSDEDLEAFFEPPIPARDEILYTTSFDFDLVVDAQGNPHIAVVIGIGSGEYSIYSPANYIAAFDIFSFDGGDTWNAYHLGNLLTFRGDFGDLTEDNRINASVTKDGTKVFVSWLDTHFEGIEDNVQPDIFCIGIDPINHKWTDVINVTEFSEAWLQAFFFVAPYYVFNDGDIYTIPFTYEDMDPNDPGAEVTFMFIKDFSFSETDFVNVGVSDVQGAEGVLCQNYPNPFSGTSVIELNLPSSTDLSLDVYDIAGQKILNLYDGVIEAGKHQFTVDASSLSPGLYFYSANLHDRTLSRKMIVR